MIKKTISNHILLKSIQNILIQFLSQGCSFITNIILIKYLNIFNYSFYIFGVTIANILAVIASMGGGGILALTWGKSNAINIFERNKNTFLVHNWYFKRGFITIILIISIIFAFNYYKYRINLIESFAIMFALPFFIANIFQSFLIAIKLTIFASLYQLGMRIIMLFLSLIFIFLCVKDISMLIGLMMIIITVYITLIWINQTLKYTFNSLKPTENYAKFAFIQYGLLLISQVDILILKLLSNPLSISLYSVALQFSNIVNFSLKAVNTNILSEIANDYKYYSKEYFQIKINSYAKIIFIISSVIIIVIIIIGYPMILIIYGKKYITSYFIFCILMIGEIINIFSGCSASILNMTGNEKKTCSIIYIALFINIFLGIIFTIYYGIYGLAIASSISMSYWNIHLLYQVIKKININPTIFIFK